MGRGGRRDGVGGGKGQSWVVCGGGGWGWGG